MPCSSGVELCQPPVGQKSGSGTERERDLAVAQPVSKRVSARITQKAERLGIVGSLVT
jgi:hypothetical protein